MCLRYLGSLWALMTSLQVGTTPLVHSCTFSVCAEEGAPHLTCARRAPHHRGAGGREAFSKAQRASEAVLGPTLPAHRPPRCFLGHLSRRLACPVLPPCGLVLVSRWLQVGRCVGGRQGHRGLNERAPNPATHRALALQGLFLWAPKIPCTARSEDTVSSSGRTVGASLLLLSPWGPAAGPSETWRQRPRLPRWCWAGGRTLSGAPLWGRGTRGPRPRLGRAMGQMPQARGPEGAAGAGVAEDRRQRGQWLPYGHWLPLPG